MTCKEIRELLQTSLDSGLSGEESGLLQDHLKACGECRKAAEQLSHLDNSLRVHLKKSPAPDFSTLHFDESKNPLDLIFAFFQAQKVVVGVLSLLFLIPVVWWNFSSPPEKKLPSNMESDGSNVEGTFVLSVLRDKVSIGNEREKLVSVPTTEKIAIKDNSYVKIDSNGEAMLLFEKASPIKLAPSTEIQVLPAGLRINRGTVWVEYRKKGSKFVLSTPVATLGIVGTKFGVEVDRRGGTSVSCVEGKVWVKGNAGGEAKTVSAGNFVAVSEDGKIGGVKVIEKSRLASESALMGEDWMKDPVIPR